MIPLRTLALAVFASSSLLLTTATQAATVSYNFTYSGVSFPYLPVTSTASGTGSFTITYTNVGAEPPSALTAFSFSDTITETAPTPSTSTFTYALSDVLADDVTLGGTVSSPTLTALGVTTNPVTGHRNQYKRGIGLVYACVRWSESRSRDHG